MEQKSGQTEQQDKIHFELRDKIAELEKDREELREKLALYVQKDRER